MLLRLADILSLWVPLDPESVMPMLLLDLFTVFSASSLEDSMLADELLKPSVDCLLRDVERSAFLGPSCSKVSLSST